MKFNSDNIAIITGILVVLSLVVYISGLNGYVPYTNPYSHSLNGYNYEGFRGVSSPYSTYVDNVNIDNPVDKYSIQQNPALRKLRGFDGLYPSPNFDDSKIDPFLQLPGSLKCDVGSMSNSKGYLCLGPNEIKLLTTRGGNATGNNFEQTAK